MASQYDTLPLTDQMIVDMTVFLDEMLMRSATRHGANSLSFRVGERVDQLKEIYAADIRSDHPKFITWSDSREAMMQRLTSSVVRIQGDNQQASVKARIGRLVQLLENLPYPCRETGKSDLER